MTAARSVPAEQQWHPGARQRIQGQEWVSRVTRLTWVPRRSRARTLVPNALPPGPQCGTIDAEPERTMDKPTQAEWRHARPRGRVRVPAYPALICAAIAAVAMTSSTARASEPDSGPVPANPSLDGSVHDAEPEAEGEADSGLAEGEADAGADEMQVGGCSAAPYQPAPPGSAPVLAAAFIAMCALGSRGRSRPS